MDHKAFLKSLSPQDKAALTGTADLPGLIHLMGHVGLLILGGVWISLGWPLWQLVMLPYGIALVFLFTLEHECTHQTPFATPALNEWVGRACGVVLLLPFEWFRYFHMAHHRYTNIPGKDPEIDHPRPETWAQFSWYISGIPYWISVGRQLIQNAFGRLDAPYLPQRIHGRLRAEARWMVCLYTLVILSLLASPVLLWIWIIPALMGQPFLRLYTLAEHGQCPHIENMLQNTRTTLTNRIVRFIAWNMPYHVEHHTYPTVPFHKLPKLHEKMQDHIAVQARGYGRFAQEYVKDF